VLHLLLCALVTAPPLVLARSSACVCWNCAFWLPWNLGTVVLPSAGLAQCALPIDGDGLIMLFEGCKKMLGVLQRAVLDAEIIDDQDMTHVCMNPFVLGYTYLAGCTFPCRCVPAMASLLWVRFGSDILA
jgi:hypothetical protein